MAPPLPLTATAQQAVETLEHFGKVSVALERTESSRSGAVCEAAKEMLLRKAKGLVMDSAGMPVLSSKSCDGTPIRVVHSASRKLTETKKAKTYGSKGVEVLVSNEFIRYRDPSEGWQTAVILSEPVPLTEGKSAPQILAAARQTWHTCRPLGAVGCVVEHYVWDRAGIEALERHSRAWHSAQPVFVSSAWPEEVAKYMDFVVVTPCALHDGQNAFRWAFLSQCKNSSLMRDLFIATSALRNSSDLFSSRIATFVTSHLKPVGPRDSQWHDEHRQLWQALDVEMDVIDIILRIELVWDGESLCYRAGAQACRPPIATASPFRHANSNRNECIFLFWSGCRWVADDK